MIYLDHNATTPLDRRVLETMLPYLENEWGNPSSPYRFASRAKIAIEKARNQIAECAGCGPGEIIFTSSGTESDNLAVRGTAHALRSRGNHIVTTAIEHHAVLNTCKALETEGFRVTYLPVNSSGVVSIKELENRLAPETILVTVMHANNETGVLQPVKEIADLTKKRGIPFHTDAVQTAGKIPYPLCELGADLISFSGHKLYGPKGTAALYIHEKTPLSPILTGGLQENGLRAGTENVAGIMGLAHAFSLSAESAEREYKRLEELRDRFEERICTLIPGTKINGTGAPRIPNTTNISFDSVDGESIVLGLDLHGICVSTGSACSTGEPEPSHVLVAMGLSPKEAQGSIRISLGRDTGEAEMDTALEALSDTIKRLRSISSV
ncbi:MAG: cysteine desulfurase [Acidobacteria bacterium]|nr:cysteine desulfurase [Acidobacteriota bacterium]